MTEAPDGFLAFATAKSFGDFVIAHSVLHRVEAMARDRLRLISNSNVKELNAALPGDVCVTLVNSEPDRVPALFDIRKRGAVATVQSAISLRREFQKITRRPGETLVFAVFGVRERFIAGGWPVTGPSRKGRNIYETYHQLLAERRIRAAAEPPLTAAGAESLGIFPESRIAEKRLTAATVSAIVEQALAVGMTPTVFVLDGDPAAAWAYPRALQIPRNFASLSHAIKAMDCVISADSLPAHLAEYFRRPTFVALRAPNEYWMPLDCFTQRRWGMFGNPSQFSAALDRFLAELRK